jgi:hypothetical protein
MNLDELNELLGEDSEALLADGLDDAIIGVAERINLGPVVAYDVDKVVEILMERDGMTDEEALEYFYYNIQGAWMGEGTPIFITKLID